MISIHMNSIDSAVQNVTMVCYATLSRFSGSISGVSGPFQGVSATAAKM